jgi:hypothetical protein
MEFLSADLCKSKGCHFLEVADCFSSYPWVARLTSKTTGAVIAIMEKWFNEFGWPQRLGSDGGPQFCHEFEEWCMTNTNTLELSSAWNPASNGLAEATVNRVKHLLEKTNGPSSFSRAMLALRNTPMANGRVLPAQALFREDLHVPGLPTVPSTEPASRTGRTVCAVRPGGQCGPSTRLATVQRGESVRVYNPDAKRWSDHATVMMIRRHGASVWLRTANGRILVQNQRFLKPLAMPQPPTQTMVEDLSGTKMVTRSRGKKKVATKS